MNAPANMTRNQKIDRQPMNWASMPPRTGPMAGPNRLPAKVNPMYFPRSAGVETSATTALAIAIVAELPVDCRHRSTNSAA